MRFTALFVMFGYNQFPVKKLLWNQHMILERTSITYLKPAKTETFPSVLNVVQPLLQLSTEDILLYGDS